MLPFFSSAAFKTETTASSKLFSVSIIYAKSSVFIFLPILNFNFLSHTAPIHWVLFIIRFSSFHTHIIALHMSFSHFIYIFCFHHWTEISMFLLLFCSLYTLSIYRITHKCK